MSNPRLFVPTIDEPMEDYLANPAFGSSSIATLSYNVAAYFVGNKSSASQDFGTAFHLLMQSEELFDQQYIVVPKTDGRTKEGQATRKMAAESGKIAITTQEFDAMNYMMDSVMSHKYIREQLGSLGMAQSVTREHSVYLEQVDGLRLKARPDILIEDGDGMVLDIKTTKCAHPSSFWNDIKAYKYDLKAYHYMEVTGVRRVALVAVDNVPPYGSAVYMIERSSLSDALIRQWECGCRKALAIQRLGFSMSECRKHFDLSHYDEGAPFIYNGAYNRGY